MENSERGRVLNGKFLHQGHRSHIVLAACASTEKAHERENGLFTKAIISILEKKKRDKSIYNFSSGLTSRKVPVIPFYAHNGAKISCARQNPQCEGHYSRRRMLFNPEAIPRRRPVFDVTKLDDNNRVKDLGADLIVYAGEILGIVLGAEFAVYPSWRSFWLGQPQGHALVSAVSGTASLLRTVGGSFCHMEPGAIALQTSKTPETFLVYAADGALECVETALAQDNKGLHRAYEWPQLAVTADAEQVVKLVVDADPEDGTIRFLHHKSSVIRELGLQKLCLSVPQDSERPARRATRVRDILQAGAHFFKHLTCEPKQGFSIFKEQHVQVTLHELIEGEDFHVIADGQIIRQMKTINHLEMDPILKAYKVNASKWSADDEEPTLYGVQITNKLAVGLFVWMFFFDCSTFEICTYAEPRITAVKTLVDAPVPGRRSDKEPHPVPVNFGNSGNQPLMFRLYEGQRLDVGFLRIFVSTRYADLSSIVQGSLKEECEERVIYELPEDEKGTRGVVKSRRMHIDKDIDGYWDVITLPLIQTSD
ncbi:hypothetical protein K488DRAFT_75255 [Vararia minispora EC-137]|uniref:Uncharacterized protein n=1 Tax=Vararia minispora EC-137 TaxID=1314806 RepID=A0ACB8Q478_9AGAM|nr:hypothetical protein K488DRAFT_75255 [Vararia minispora EC-137]